MLKNKIEIDVRTQCIGESGTPARAAERIGTSSSWVNKIVRNREQIVNKIFLAMPEEPGQDGVPA